MSKLVRRALQIFALTVALVAVMAPAASAAEDGPAEKNGRYIIVFNDSVDQPASLAREQVDSKAGELGFIYRHALEGYSAELSDQAAKELTNDPSVAYIEEDARGGVAAQTTPTGIARTFASANKALSINEADDLRASADVAVIDTGIDYTHPDLNVVSRTDCSNGATKAGECVNESGTDGYGHGTHVAGTIAAIDNGFGVAGIAPGAGLWAVKVLDSSGFGELSEYIAGIDWVTAHASEIEVANSSLRYFTTSSTAFSEAMKASIAAGVVHVVAAGNENEPVKYVPGNYPDAITVSALADYDGKSGAVGSPTCENYGSDDSKATFSNYGASIDVAAPGVCIYSTVPGGYGFNSGTSMASPHVAGAAAVLAGLKNPASKADVEAIRNTILAAGNSAWTDTSPDGVKEPLLDLSNEATFKLLKPSPPENTALPVASPATPLQAVPETTTTGTWTNEPTSYAYQWQRCNAAGGECANIAGATKSAYTPVAEDVGKTLAVKVTATNAGGSNSASSKATNKVKPVGQISAYTVPAGGSPSGIATGSDGNLWFTNADKSKVAKITTAGTVTEYSVGSASFLAGIAPGPDGNLWFNSAGNGKVSKVTTAGSITEYAPGFINNIGITAGPDNNLWFTATEGKVAKITTSGTATSYALPKGSLPIDITAGPDGKLWFTNYGTNKIAKITTSGSITEYALSAGSGPRGITSGPDGNLWFTRTYANKIGKITPSGTVTEYTVPAGSWPENIVSGPDGNLWFANYQSSKIGRSTTSGTITEFALPAGSGPNDLTVGPDQQIWFTEYDNGKVAAITP